MNEIQKSLHNRKSVRAFTHQPLTPEVKHSLLEAAIAAPTAGCQQLYTILDITDQALKEKLAVSCGNQPFIATAPVVLVFCADCLRWQMAYQEADCQPRKPGVGDLLLATSDANIAAQNVVVAAESLGLGSCYIGDIMEQYEIHRELLHLPDYVMPVAMLVIGYPTQQQKDRKKPERLPLEAVVHKNGYHKPTGAELRQMFQARCGQQSYEAFMTAFCKRKYNSAFSQEMSRSVAAYLAQFEGGKRV